MKRRVVVLAGTLTLLALVLSSAGATTQPQLSAAQIMEKNYFVSKLKSLRAESDMVLINHKGQKRQRKSSNIVKLQSNGVDTNFLVKFSSPDDIKGRASCSSSTTRARTISGSICRP